MGRKWEWTHHRRPGRCFNPTNAVKQTSAASLLAPCSSRPSSASSSCFFFSSLVLALSSCLPPSSPCSFPAVFHFAHLSCLFLPWFLDFFCAGLQHLYFCCVFLDTKFAMNWNIWFVCLSNFYQCVDSLCSVLLLLREWRHRPIMS